jgi:hypothetical protein
MRPLLALVALTFLGCRSEPKWVTAATHEADGWKVVVPRSYVPYAANLETLKQKSPELAATLDGDGGAEIRARLGSMYLLTTPGLGCSLAFTHLTAPGLCERVAQMTAQRGPASVVRLPNGEWVAQTTVGSEGGTLFSWDHCAEDHLWSVVSSTLPSCIDEAKAREAELVAAIGAATLKR